MKGKAGLWLIIGAVGVIIMWLVGTYNNFILLGENANTAWAQVENQYQRRFDLIPNLVETVKGISEQEQALFIGVSEARAKAGQTNVNPGDAASLAQFQAAQGELSSALSRLLVTVEQYPELKSNENFLQLQSQLEGTENRISTERMRYNDVAKEYNVKARSIPGVWFVSIFALDREKGLFESVEGADSAPKVDFNLNN